jgi:ankyrin repeat protein
MRTRIANLGLVVALVLHLCLSPLEVLAGEREEAIKQLDAKGIVRSPQVLIDAAMSGNKEVVVLLLNSGMSPNVRDPSPRDRGPDRTGWTPLLWALWERNSEIAEILLDHGANPNFQGNSAETTALNLAISLAPTKIALKAIELGAKLDVPDMAGRTPVFLAARDDKLDLTRLLVDRRVDINVRDVIGWTPLIYALRNGQREAARFLLEKGADINHGSDAPIILAAEWGYLDVIKMLLARGADINKPAPNGATCLGAAARNGHSEVVEFLVAIGADVNKGQPILGAAFQNRLQIVKFLLDKGADVNGTDLSGRSALWLVSRDEYEPMMKLLLSRGANPSGQSVYGVTALMIAAESGQETAVRLLLANGADVRAKDKKGRTALEYAKGHPTIRKLLVAGGASS